MAELDGGGMKEVSAQSLQFPAPDSYTRGRPVERVADDGLHNLAARARYTPVNERDIRLVYFPLFELRRELPVSKVVLGHEHQTRSHLVQAMDDPWAQFPSRSGKAADVVQQGVDQR